ncbi:hypothetical protein ACOSQ3_031029 [Xanthoceras sorbifolium]
MISLSFSYIDVVADGSSHHGGDDERCVQAFWVAIEKLERGFGTRFEAFAQEMRQNIAAINHVPAVNQRVHRVRERYGPCHHINDTREHHRYRRRVCELPPLYDYIDSEDDDTPLRCMRLVESDTDEEVEELAMGGIRSYAY